MYKTCFKGALRQLSETLAADGLEFQKKLHEDYCMLIHKFARVETDYKTNDKLPGSSWACLALSMMELQSAVA